VRVHGVHQLKGAAGIGNSISQAGKETIPLKMTVLHDTSSIKAKKKTRQLKVAAGIVSNS
jgi:hypothetical protein